MATHNDDNGIEFQELSFYVSDVADEFFLGLWGLDAGEELAYDETTETVSGMMDFQTTTNQSFTSELDCVVQVWNYDDDEWEDTSVLVENCRASAAWYEFSFSPGPEHRVGPNWHTGLVRLQLRRKDTGAAVESSPESIWGTS